MNTTDFMRACISGKRTKPGHCNNRVIWRGGILYSYGAHYPLAWKYGDAWLVNNRGYSVTTAKHIGRAREAVRFATGKDAISVQLPGGVYASDLHNATLIQQAHRDEIHRALVDIAKHKRPGTKVLEWKTYALTELRKNAASFRKLAARTAARAQDHAESVPTPDIQ